MIEYDSPLCIARVGSYRHPFSLAPHGRCNRSVWPPSACLCCASVLRRRPPDAMSSTLTSPSLIEPELHVIGEILGCSLRTMTGGIFNNGGLGSSLLFSFGGRNENAFAGWEIKKGKEWKCVGGREAGQTQVDYPEVRHTRVGTGKRSPPLCLHPLPPPLIGAQTHARPTDHLFSLCTRILIPASGITPWTFTTTRVPSPAGRSWFSKWDHSTSTAESICVRRHKRHAALGKRI